MAQIGTRLLRFLLLFLLLPTTLLGQAGINSPAVNVASLPGSDADAKIAACIAGLPSTGGVCDARGLKGAQTINANPFASVGSKPVTLILGNSTFTVSAQIDVSSKTDIAILCQGTVLTSSTAITMVNMSSGTRPVMEGCRFTGTPTGALTVASSTDAVLRDVHNGLTSGTFLTTTSATRLFKSNVYDGTEDTHKVDSIEITEVASSLIPSSDADKVLGSSSLTWDAFLDDVTAGKVNNVLFVDGVKYTTIQAAHDAAGTGAEIRVTTAQAISSNLTISKNNIKILIASNVTLTVSAGIQISITGDDVEFAGSGDSTLISATGDSTTVPFYVSSGAARPYLHDFKIAGNRAQTNKATALQIGDTSAVIDSPRVERVRVSDAGAAGIYIIKSTNSRVRDNRVIDAHTSGILLDTSAHYSIIEGNYIENPCRGAVSAHSGVGIVSTSDPTNFTHNKIENNVVNFTVSNSNQRGMELDYFQDSEVVGNTVIGGTSEAFSFTGLRNLVQGNLAHGSGTGGFLFFLASGAASDWRILDNQAYDNTNYGFQVGWGTTTGVTASHFLFQGNRARQAGGSQSIGLQTLATGATTPALSNFYIINNALEGNGAGGSINLDATISGEPFIVGEYSSGWRITPVLRGKRYTAELGTALVAGDFALHANWGAGAAIGTITGTDQAWQGTVTAAGVPGASPTLILTFKDGTWTNAPLCISKMTGGTGTITDLSDSTSATAHTITFNGTPAAGSTYIITSICMGR